MEGYRIFSFDKLVFLLINNDMNLTIHYKIYNYQIYMLIKHEILRIIFVQFKRLTD